MAGTKSTVLKTLKQTTIQIGIISRMVKLKRHPIPINLDLLVLR